MRVTTAKLNSYANFLSIDKISPYVNLQDNIHKLSAFYCEQENGFRNCCCRAEDLIFQLCKLSFVIRSVSIITFTTDS
ncbi:unnamed protein product [Rhizophagus irregularis]|nr:unnamed protein product [Rhizophagus irregularis]